MSNLTSSDGFINADAAVEFAATLKPDAKEKTQDKNKSSFQNNIEKNQ